MRYGELFAGVGGLSLGLERAGWDAAFHAEIDEFARRVLAARFPGVPLYGDVSELDGNRLLAECGEIDLLSGGSPCFPAERLVLTELGYREISTVTVGMRVLTHTGKWQRVLRTGSKISATIILRGQGNRSLETTPAHPFLASTKRINTREMSEPSWLPAGDMAGSFWATPVAIESLPIPPLEKYTHRGPSAEVPEFNEDFFWFVGRWLGDGWLRRGQRHDRPEGQQHYVVFVCTGHDDADVLEERLKRLPIKWGRNSERTATRFRTHNRQLALWLEEHFGRYAHGKRFPAWVFGMPRTMRQALLAGFLSADGWTDKQGVHATTTVSRELAFGLRLLTEGLGYSTTIAKPYTKKSDTIEGRRVNIRPFYGVRWRKNGRRTSRVEAHGYAWGLVRDVLEGHDKVQVFNLEVEEDNSYVVENIVVHNCQDLSQAGRRAGIIDGERSNLFFQQVRLWNEIGAPFLLWENVHGALSSSQGEDFRYVLSSLVGADVGRAVDAKGRPKRWAGSGLVLGPRGSAAWRVMDAQHWGPPQRRRRVFVLASRTGFTRPDQVLFEFEGDIGDFAARLPTAQNPARVARGGVAAPVEAGADGPDSRQVLSFNSHSNGEDLNRANLSVVPTLTGESGGTHTPAVAAVDFRHGTLSDVTPTIQGGHQPQGYSLNKQPGILVFDTKQSGESGEVSPTLRAMAHDKTWMNGGGQLGVARMLGFGHYVEDGTASALKARDYKDATDLIYTYYNGIFGVPRRLMPVECERLMDWPDDWTNVADANGKPASDSQRYRACGNGVVSGHAEWIGMRLRALLEQRMAW